MDLKTIMVHMELEQRDKGIYALAGDLAQRLGTTRIIGIAGCQPAQLVYDETYIAGEIMLADRREIGAELRQAERRFKDMFKGKAKHLEWRYGVTPGSLAEYMASEARATDLLITGPDIGGSLFDHSRQVKIADLVFKAGRPVMIVPETYEQLDLSHVMIGWKDTGESRRALAAALPLLAFAARISVMALAPDDEKRQVEAQVDDVVQWLSRHDVKAIGETYPLKGADTMCFKRLVREKEPGLVIAGAYGRSRLTEWVLGGVTRDFLLDPDRPVLLSH